jgi:hypothetical protein
MKSFKNLEKRVHGWLPKEPNVSIQQSSSQKSLITGAPFGILLLILGFAGSFLGALDTTLGLGLFSGFGQYISVMLLFICTTIAAITAILRQNKEGALKHE